MKSLLLILIIPFSLSSAGQITFEQSYDINIQTEFWSTEIEEGNTKYVHFDRIENQFSLYNLDHSLYQQIDIPVEVGEVYNVGYITKGLFDCDDSNIEYAVMSQSDPNGTFYVFRDDGSLFWSKDSVLAPYCYGCNTGSVTIKPIRNTNDGVKLFLMSDELTQVGVYDLCGDFVSNVDLVKNEQFVQIFPNPSSESFNFKVDAPSNFQTYEVIIHDAQMRVIHEFEGLNNRLQNIDASEWSSGIYFFSLRIENDIIQTGKFQVIK